MKERILAIEDMIKIIEYIVQRMLNLKTPAIKHLRNMRHYEKTKPKSSRYRGRKQSAQKLRKYFDQHQRIFPNLNKDMPVKSTRNIKNTK